MACKCAQGLAVASVLAAVLVLQGCDSGESNNNLRQTAKTGREVCCSTCSNLDPAANLTGPDAQCAEAIAWVQSKGVYENPDWYPGLGSDSSFLDVQRFLGAREQANCSRACEPCAAPRQFDECDNRTRWVREKGIYLHLDGYPGLNANSSYAQVQNFLFQKAVSNKCPPPCAA